MFERNPAKAYVFSCMSCGRQDAIREALDPATGEAERGLTTLPEAKREAKRRGWTVCTGGGDWLCLACNADFYCRAGEDGEAS